MLLLEAFGGDWSIGLRVYLLPLLDWAILSEGIS